jgi:hypothetical protein
MQLKLRRSLSLENHLSFLFCSYRANNVAYCAHQGLELDQKRQGRRGWKEEGKKTQKQGEQDDAASDGAVDTEHRSFVVFVSLSLSTRALRPASNSRGASASLTPQCTYWYWFMAAEGHGGRAKREVTSFFSKPKNFNRAPLRPSLSLRAPSASTRSLALSLSLSLSSCSEM